MNAFGVIGDVQCPFHDPRAVSVAGQILADCKLKKLVINGDFGDYRTLSTRYPIRNVRDSDAGTEVLISQMREELERQRSLLKELVSGVAAKETWWTDGNHEFRVFRAMLQAPSLLQLLSIDSIRNALAIPQLLDFASLKIKYAGEYPKGIWLLGEDVPSDKNVWVEHGYISSAKAGYTVSRLQEQRQTSVVINHCERLAGPIWRHLVGKRDYFGIENGNLSIFAVPGQGDGILTSYPFNSPDQMNKQQGFSILFHDGKEWFPFTIPIRNGKAWFNGKQYKA